MRRSATPVLTEKVAIVTGASGDLGGAIALRLARDGMRIVAHGSSPETAARAASRLADEGATAVPCGGDMADPATALRLRDAAIRQFGRIDVLVNNSGTTADALLLRLSPEAYCRVLRVNLLGAAQCIRAVAPPMREERGGRIINISSVIGLIGNVGQSNYAASKSGLVALTRSGAKKLAPWGITVNGIAPGFIRTRMTANLPPETVEAIQSRIPLGRLGEAEDVAGWVSFLASEGASYITGQILTVDGGMVM